MKNQKPRLGVRTDNGILAAEITLRGVTAIDGLIPLAILQSGTMANIPKWTETSFDDLLTVYWSQNGIEEPIFVQDYPAGSVPPGGVDVEITPARMAVDGNALIYYIITAFGIRDPSPQKPLIIDHFQTQPIPFPPVTFPDVNPTGYLNCLTGWPPNNTRGELRLNQGIRVSMPALSPALPTDDCIIHVQGYRTLNGAPGDNNEHVVPESVATITRQLTQVEIQNGFIQIIPFTPSIKALLYNDSAAVDYRVTRAGRLIGSAHRAVVKVDRGQPGDLPCYYFDT
jgi:hypothetical protein